MIELGNHKSNTTLIATHIDIHIVTQFVDNQYFAVYKWDIHGDLKFNKPHAYCLVIIIDGTGTLAANDKHHDIQKGSSFISTTEDEDIHFVDNISAIVSHPG